MSIRVESSLFEFATGRGYVETNPVETVLASSKTRLARSRF
jgi:hypothetical protein